MTQILKMPTAIPLIGGGLNFQPMQDFVLIEPIRPTETAGGIALPEDAETGEPLKGRVVRKGPGKTTEYGAFVPVEGIEVGDLFYLTFAYAQPMNLSLGGRKYLLCRSRDLVGKVEEKPAAVQSLAA